MTSRRNVWYPSRAGHGRSRSGATRGGQNPASLSVTVRSAAQALIATLLVVGAVALSHAQPSPPPPLKNLVDDQIVAKIGYCRGEYTLTMASGAQRRYPEINLRFKTDASRTGPEPGKPALLAAGMRGDRGQVIFGSLDDLKRFLVEECRE